MEFAANTVRGAPIFLWQWCSGWSTKLQVRRYRTLHLSNAAVPHQATNDLSTMTRI
jgi:hypothetical protein